LVYLHNKVECKLYVSCNKLQVKTLSIESGLRIKDQENEGIIGLDDEVLIRQYGAYKCENKSLIEY